MLTAHISQHHIEHRRISEWSWYRQRLEITVERLSEIESNRITDNKRTIAKNNSVDNTIEKLFSEANTAKCKHIQFSTNSLFRVKSQKFLFIIIFICYKLQFIFFALLLGSQCMQVRAKVLVYTTSENTFPAKQKKKEDRIYKYIYVYKPQEDG